VGQPLSSSTTAIYTFSKWGMALATGLKVSKARRSLAR